MFTNQKRLRSHMEAKKISFTLLILLVISLSIYFSQRKQTQKKEVYNLDSDSSKERAAIVMLLKSDEKSVRSALKVLQRFDEVFNQKFRYPVVIFHEGDLDEFNKIQIHSAVESVGVQFVRVHFSIPQWVNMTRVPEKIKEFGGYDYLGYRHMCKCEGAAHPTCVMYYLDSHTSRFFSGLVFQNPALAEYDYYLRLDDDSMFLCDIDYDIFRYMRVNKKKYGWIIEFHEPQPISGETLWETTRQFMKERAIEGENLGAITNLFGEYTRCHYWNNFEVVDLNFFRSKEYLDFFNHLDEQGGFFYYRWGDALVRTLGVHLFLQPYEIHHFDLAYEHQSACNIPVGACEFQEKCKLVCSEGICPSCTHYAKLSQGINVGYFFLVDAVLIIVLVLLCWKGGWYQRITTALRTKLTTNTNVPKRTQ